MTISLERVGVWAQLIISLIAILMFGFVLGALLYTMFVPRVEDVAPGVREVLLVLIGVLGATFKDVYNFWLGTSLSSAKKDATLAQKTLAP